MELVKEEDSKVECLNLKHQGKHRAILYSTRSRIFKSNNPSLHMCANRKASHAGSWYSSNPAQLNQSLTRWLDDVKSDKIPTPDKVCVKDDASHTAGNEGLELPVKGCRAIIAP